LKGQGVTNIAMTGCPALYNLDYLEKNINSYQSLNKIIFSLGVSFAKSKAMEKSTKKILLDLKKKFKDADLTVMFHHSIDKKYLDTPDPIKNLFYKNVELSRWLDKNKIKYKDISGSAK